MDISEGDVVVIKSNTEDLTCPKFVVQTVYHDGMCECVWWNGKEFLNELFKKSILVKV